MLLTHHTESAVPKERRDGYECCTWLAAVAGGKREMKEAGGDDDEEGQAGKDVCDERRAAVRVCAAATNPGNPRPNPPSIWHLAAIQPCRRWAASTKKAAAAVSPRSLVRAKKKEKKKKRRKHAPPPSRLWAMRNFSQRHPMRQRHSPCLPQAGHLL